MTKMVLFQGDSITDANRSREHDFWLGVGYPTLIASHLQFEQPGEYDFLNRAISGNRVVDLYARWKLDCVNLAPDIVSILIGVNDVWHEVGDRKNGVEADRFERVYDMLLELTRERLPQAKILLLEPFVLRGTATEANWDFFASEVPLRAQATRRVAEKHGVAFLPLQQAFDDACKRAPGENWLRDGVHPAAAGHELIARKWLEAVRTL